MTVKEVRVRDSYVATGDKAIGLVFLDDNGATSAAHDWRLRVTVRRRVDVAAAVGDTPGETAKVVLDAPWSELSTGRWFSRGVPFELDAGNCLLGELRAHIELLSADGKTMLSEAWSEPVKIGIRKRVSLAGDWQVTRMEPFAYESQWRPKDWKQPELKSVRLPGPLLRDEWFRGWITVARDIRWDASGDLQPRFLRLSGAADSALVKIGGLALPETRPTEDMAVLSHWVEFHSPYKGEANAQTRLLFLDLTPQGPVNLALPAALPAAGQAHVEMRIRDTSGMFRPRPVPGILGDLHFDLAPPAYVKEISFDTEKPADDRRFKFKVALGNESGRPLHGKLRTVYGRYDGKIAYTGSCPAYATVDLPVDLPPGGSTVEVVRDEKPRFDTCRATFLLLDDTGRMLDGDSINFHTVTFEVRNRRDFYLNNERFLVKGQGSAGDAPHKRWQMRMMGGNAFRGPTDPEQINLYQSEGLLTSCGGALLASVEKCTFYNPKDTSNITRAVKGFTSVLSDCPGVIMWEATNELHGEPEEARVAILEAFHKLDPYHRPVLATKGSGEWEAEARDGRVKGVDVVGCQYLLSKEGVDSISAAVTEQPIMSTEVNWNDASFGRDNLWQYWLDKGIAGSLLFDYSGGALDQPVPTVPPPDNDPVGMLIKRGNRDLYQDLTAAAVRRSNGSVALQLGNQMPYRLHDITLRLPSIGRLSLPDLAPGAAATISLPSDKLPEPQQPLVVRAEYTTHGGLPHIAILTPPVTAAPETAKANEKGGAK
jgi:hypothetical protein